MIRRDIIAIGGSWGAVDAIKQLLRELPGDLAATLFIAIHVGARGNDLLAEIFAEQAAITTSTARDGDELQPGHAYVAPADHHLLLIGGVVRLGHGPRENMSRPAIDPLLRSVGACFGPRAIGVILTGMLNDGASGLADLKRCGGLTVVQSPRDAAASDMPWEALRATQVDYRAPLSGLPGLLAELSAQEAGAPIDVPADIAEEVEIALGTARTAILPDGLSDVTALTCPACGGVLSQIRREPPLRYRCQVGHAYTAEALVSQQESAVDEAIRLALRVVEERVTLTEAMRDDAHRAGRRAAASSYDERLAESRAHADVLQQAIEKTKRPAAGRKRRSVRH